MLFADLRGSMEFLADRDPEEARKILDPILASSARTGHREKALEHFTRATAMYREMDMQFWLAQVEA